jgi:hypothetical protein
VLNLSRNVTSGQINIFLKVVNKTLTRELLQSSRVKVESSPSKHQINKTYNNPDIARARKNE